MQVRPATSFSEDGMLSCAIRVVGVALWLAAAGVAQAETLPLPEDLIDLRTSQGEQMLQQSGALEAYVPLSVNFVTQKTQTFCGVASLVIVLNTLGVPSPTTPEYEPYHTFTQDNLLNEQTEAILPVSVLSKQGMTLDELGKLAALHPVEA